MSKKWVCVCGKEVSTHDTRHRKNCSEFKKYEDNFIKKFLSKYTNKYNLFLSKGMSAVHLKKLILRDLKLLSKKDLFTEGYANRIFQTYFRKFYDKYEMERWERRNRKSSKTMKQKYGVENAGQLESHKERLRKSNNEKMNPFSTEEFALLEFIKGNRILKEQEKEYYLYRKEVNKITRKNIKKLDHPLKCYYTGIPITNNKEYHYNMLNYATIDHKIPIIAGFLKGISAKVIGGVDNLCWCAKFINSVKGNLTEKEFVNSDYMFRFNLIKPKIMKLLEEKGFHEN